MICWGAYRHAASSGGDLARAVNGSRRMRPPQWVQRRGSSIGAGSGFLGSFGLGNSALACSSSPPGWAEA